MGKDGVSQVTYERTKKDKDKDHLDWWLYKDAQPQGFKGIVDE